MPRDLGPLVQLKNGEYEPEKSVGLIMQALRVLATESRSHFERVCEWILNEGTPPTDLTIAKLRQLDLLYRHEPPELYGDVQDVLASAVEKRGSAWILTASPLHAEQPHRPRQ